MKHPTIRNLTLMTLLLLKSFVSHAGYNSSVGNIIDLTSVSAGVMIKLDTAAPTICVGIDGNQWMLIPAENKSVTALLLMMYSMGKRNATVYSTGTVVNGWCVVSQYDPTE
jgi:hypothetical protein